VLEVLHTEPVTRHAYTKPRGYPGDAALIDLIYGESAPPEPLSPLARHLHAWATSQQGFESVRDRRDRLTRLIDVTAAERKDARILSLACGHLREARRSTAVRDGTIAEFVALDQDRRSLDTIACDLPTACVTRVNASIRRFLVDASMYGTFDLIYAAGLYDYLDDDLARRLTTSIAAALRPGGSMLVANFAPELREAAYMEAVMRWNLIYRNEDQVRQFAADISPETLADATVSRDALGNIVYLSIRKC
jgi:extracellular factor (EF) 3-hydroxypalmitic acid methyl ester biosynthesis protein